MLSIAIFRDNLKKRTQYRAAAPNQESPLCFGGGNMRRQDIEIQNCDGSRQRWAGVGEVEQMLAKGEVYRVSKRKDRVQRYRLKEYPQASNSRESAACITTADMRALAGLQRVDQIWVERLIGLNLLPEGKQVPAYGYL